MANYISKLITQYFSKRHKVDTEIKIQQWLIDGEHAAEKDEALSQIWEQINGKADKAVYASLKKVNAKIGKSSSRSWFLKHTLPRVAGWEMIFWNVHTVNMRNGIACGCLPFIRRRQPCISTTRFMTKGEHRLSLFQKV